MIFFFLGGGATPYGRWVQMCRGPILGIARAANGLVKKGPITRAKYIFPNNVYYNQGKHVSQKSQADTRNWMIVTDRHDTYNPL